MTRFTCPIIQVIRDTNILKEFPDKTEGDLYLWVLDHQHYLESQEGIPLQPPEEAAREFFGEEGEKPPANGKKDKKKIPQNRRKRNHDLATLATPPCRSLCRRGDPAAHTRFTPGPRISSRLDAFSRLARLPRRGALRHHRRGTFVLDRPNARRCCAPRVDRSTLDGFRLIAGTGTPSLSETIDLTRLAFDLGYDAALVVPPYYFRKATDEVYSTGSVK